MFVINFAGGGGKKKEPTSVFLHTVPTIQEHEAPSVYFAIAYGTS